MILKTYNNIYNIKKQNENAWLNNVIDLDMNNIFIPLE